MAAIANSKNKWIGLLEAHPLDGINEFGENRGACVTAVVFCESQDAYLLKIKQTFAELGLKLIEYEDVESCSERLEKFELTDDLKKAMSEVSDKNEVVFMNFHTFPLDDEI